MLNRIALVLQTQNLTVSAFADRIGVQRSALSHVLSGRNNPSLDFVTKILRTFPEIRSQWLLFGEGKMYDSLSDARAAEPGNGPEAETGLGGLLQAAGSTGIPEPSGGGEAVASGFRPGGIAGGIDGGIDGRAVDAVSETGGNAVPETEDKAETMAETMGGAVSEAVGVAMSEAVPAAVPGVVSEVVPGAAPGGVSAGRSYEAGQRLAEPLAAVPADFAPVQADNPRLIKVVFFYSDGHFEEYAHR